MKTQQLEIKLSNKTEEDIKKARRKSTQAGECGATAHLCSPGQKHSRQGRAWDAWRVPRTGRAGWGCGE